jgi:hypothetical protein
MQNARSKYKDSAIANPILLCPRHYVRNLPHIKVIMIFIYSYQTTDKIIPVLAMKAYDGVEIWLHPFLT